MQILKKLKASMTQTFAVTKCPYCEQENYQKINDFNQLAITICSKCGGKYLNILNFVGRITKRKIRLPGWLKKFNADIGIDRRYVDDIGKMLEGETLSDEIREEDRLLKEALNNGESMYI